MSDRKNNFSCIDSTKLSSKISDKNQKKIDIRESI